MTTRADIPRDREDRAVAALDEYLATMRAGRATSKSAFLARHPEMATELEECLACLDLIAEPKNGATELPTDPGRRVPRCARTSSMVST